MKKWMSLKGCLIDFAYALRDKGHDLAFSFFINTRADGKRTRRMQDVLRQGRFSCAWWISILLGPFGLLKEGPCLDVDRLVEKLVASGWQETSRVRQGAIIIWAPQISADDRKLHRHVGIATNRTMAMSHRGDTDPRGPTIHSVRFRKIELILWHRALNTPIRLPQDEVDRGWW